MKLIEFKCPACGADLKADPSREMMYCEYCGKKLILDDEAIHVKLSIENAKEAGFEFEQGRMQAQSSSVRAEIEKLERIADALPEYEMLTARYNALDLQCREDKKKHTRILPILGWALLCLFLASLIDLNVNDLMTTHDPTRLIVILVSIWIIVWIISSQYHKFKGAREKAEDNIRQRNEAGAELETMLTESGLDSIPSKYRTTECIDFFHNALLSQTALTIAQAIRNYELFQQQLELVEQNKRQLELQEKQLREMKAMRKKLDEKDDDDDDDSALGTIAAVGLGLLVGRFIFKKWW